MARDLRKAGFKDVMILKGGLGAWTNAGLPIETRTDISPVGMAAAMGQRLWSPDLALWRARNPFYVEPLDHRRSHAR